MRTAKPALGWEFRGDEFYSEVAEVLRQRGISWRQLAIELGISASTFTRWSRGRSLDGSTLAALGAYCGLNPSEYVGDRAPANAKGEDCLKHIISLVRTKLELSPEMADVFTGVIT